MFLVQAGAIRLLVRQGLAVRGHSEEEGNLYQFMRCLSDNKREVDKWMESGRYSSHDIINEVIEIMANTVLRKLLQSIRSAAWYSLIADEVRCSLPLRLPIGRNCIIRVNSLQ